MSTPKAEPSPSVLSTPLTPGSGPSGKTGEVWAGIYVRMSMDREGAGLGVARQEEDDRALCDRRGFRVRGVYVDNDVSATSGKPRKQWLRLLADVRAGRVNAIVCWHVDRLTRSPRELEDVIDLHDRYGVQLATCTGEIDLATPTGRMVASTLGAAARHEAEHKAERQRRERRQAAEAGQPHPHGGRGYGYADDGVTVIDAEARYVKEAARRVLGGESVYSVCQWLNTRDIRTVRGNTWTLASLRNLLVSARISGRREHTPTDSYRGTRPPLGEITKADAWPQIITPDESDTLRVMLTRPNPRRRGKPRRYLLSGILRCDRCGHGLKGRNHHGTPRYVCTAGPGLPGCGRITVYAEHADDEVRDRILTALDDPDTLTTLLNAARDTDHDTDADTAAAQLRALEERREQLAAEWATGDITRKEWSIARRALDTQAEQLTQALATSEDARALAEFAAMEGDMWQRWDNLTHGAKRALVAACVDRITVYPAASRRWDPDRIDPVFRV